MNILEVDDARAAAAAAADMCVAAMEADKSGCKEESLALYKSAVELAPRDIGVRLLCAYAQGAAGDRVGARATIAATPCIERLSSRELRELGDAAIALGEDRTAIRIISALSEDAPDNPELQSSLGALHHRVGDMAQAAVVLNRLFLRWPAHVPGLINRARLLSETGSQAEALAAYDRVLELDPGHAAARWYRGLIRLLVGNMQDGWRDHEARRKLPFMQSVTPRGIRPWEKPGADRIRGKRVLLWGEQGLGDQIMGARFAGVLTGLGARVTVRTHPSLVTLFRGIAGLEAVTARGDVLPEADLHVPMLSVPRLLEDSGDGLIEGRPYLAPQGVPSDRVSELISRLDCDRESNRPRIGLVWAGSPSHGNDHNRSLPFAQLLALISRLDVTWLSLQLGERRNDLDVTPEPIRGRVVDGSHVIRDFNDTAHLLSRCTALITVDTSVAHLGGALGVPTAVMLPAVPDWRWRLSGRDSYWYESVQLARQTDSGAWEHAVDEVSRIVLSGAFSAFPHQ